MKVKWAHLKEEKPITVCWRWHMGEGGNFRRAWLSNWHSDQFIIMDKEQWEEALNVFQRFAITVQEMHD